MMGAVYTGQTAPINLASFAVGSGVSTEIYSSHAFRLWVMKAIIAQSGSIVPQLTSSWQWKDFNLPASAGGIYFPGGNFIVPGVPDDLNVSIGHATISLNISLKAEIAGGYLRVIPTVTGQVTDLYDFLYSGLGPSPYAAEVEAGYVGGAGSPGHVFKEEINLSTVMPFMDINLDSIPAGH